MKYFKLIAIIVAGILISVLLPEKLAGVILIIALGILAHMDLQKDYKTDEERCEERIAEIKSRADWNYNQLKRDHQQELYQLNLRYQLEIIKVKYNKEFEVDDMMETFRQYRGTIYTSYGNEVIFEKTYEDFLFIEKNEQNLIKIVEKIENIMRESDNPILKLIIMRNDIREDYIRDTYLPLEENTEKNIEEIAKQYVELEKQDYMFRRNYYY